MPKNQTSFKPGVVTNPKGRPPKGMSLTELMREHLENIPEGQEKTHKEVFIEKVLELAKKGDATAMKITWNYLEGMPKQNVDVTSGGEKITPILGGVSVVPKLSPSEKDTE